MTDNVESKIGASMVITGEVQCDSDVKVEGTITGSLTGRSLVAYQNARVVGHVRFDAIECFGRMEGDIVTKAFTLRNKACHVGTVETSELTVEPGAILDCALQSGVPKKQQKKDKIKMAVPSSSAGPKAVLAALQTDSRLCCMDIANSGRQQLLHTLFSLLEKDKPLIKITGESGSGKSVLVEKLKSSLPEHIETLVVTDQVGAVAVLLEQVGKDLGIDNGAKKPQSDLLGKIKAVLDKKKSVGKKVVLLVDDAQDMYPASMEGAIKFLTNALGDEESMLQLILLGTKEMEEKMVDTIVEYFEDETNCQLTLQPLTMTEMGEYLQCSLQQAVGGDGEVSASLLPFETIKKIHSMSRGNLAEINTLTDKSLQAAVEAGVDVVAPDFL